MMKWFSGERMMRIALAFLMGVALGLSWLYAQAESVDALRHNALLVQFVGIVAIATPVLTIAIGALFNRVDAASGHAAAEGDCPSALRRLERALFQERPFLVPFAIIGAVYLVHMAIVAPGMLSQEDTKDQLLAFFNLTNFRAHQVVLLSPDVQLTNHHPVLHTLFLGLCVQVGLAFGSGSAGLMLYTVLQVVLFVAALAAVFPFFERHGAPLWLRWATLALFTLCPKLWNLSCLATKDVLFAAAVLSFLIACVDWLWGRKGRAVAVRLFVFALLACLLRNNGVFLVAAAAPFLLVPAATSRGASNRARGLACVMGAVAVYAVVILAVLPALQITGGSPRETLSVPLQQTARCLKYHSKDVTPEELAAISRVADPARMAKKYEPALADYVKNLYRRDATADDRAAFLGAWASLAVRHPRTCLAASVDNHYGFYCFTASAYEYYQSPTWSREKMHAANYELVLLSDGKIVCGFREWVPRWLVDAGTRAYIWFTGLPVIAQTMQAAFYFWLLMLGLAYGITRKRRVAVMVGVALLTLFAVSLLGPANAVGYTRYIAPAMVAWPALVLGCVVGVGNRPGETPCPQQA